MRYWICFLFLSAPVLSALAQKKAPAAVRALMVGTGIEKNEAGTNRIPQGTFASGAARELFRIRVPEGGANGAAVVYNPREKLYYAAQAGNKEFPLVIFNEAGNVLSYDQKTLMDIRGLWYNPNTRQIEGNGYKDFGWFAYNLDKKGFPESIRIIREGRSQPDDHSAGVYNPDANEVYFLSGTDLIVYRTNGLPLGKVIKLKVGARSNADNPIVSQTEFEENYNFRSIVYTGMAGAEIGLLNTSKKQVELYDLQTGYLTRTISLPLTFEPESYFNFSFSNNTFWLFDKSTRHWVGYR
ncbi:MAG: hypothetical protein ACK4E8_00510 [Lacibacter sp.]|jgi:hypothetical protein